MNIKPFHVKAVLFDFDGTLTRPEDLDFDPIKTALGCPPDHPVLEFIQCLPDPSEKTRAMQALDKLEADGARNARANPGVRKVVEKLRDQGIRLGIVSRNSRRCILRAFENFNKPHPSDFDVIISRNDPVAPKPKADGILLAAKKLGVVPEETMVVGDFIFDMQAGRDAGAVTVFLGNGTDRNSEDCDFTIARLLDLLPIVRWGRPLTPGKLPNDLLASLLDDFACDDDAVLIRPGVGEDTAAVALDRARVLVLTSDPITFATDAIGRYAVLVNANDMATSGALPRWLLTTLLFPAGATPSQIGHVMYDLAQTCRQWHITLCGGHTEITDAVSRPVVVGTLVGTVQRDKLVDKQKIRSGDRLLLTKGICIEGTAIVAREFGTRLAALGMRASEIERCRSFLSQISILPEARIAADTQGVSAMHDITEGGLATAVRELSVAGNSGIRVQMDAIPVYPETRHICRLMDMDPLGLIGSGSLLICCRKRACKPLMAAIQSAGIAVACIGQITETGGRVRAYEKEKTVVWPHFDVDEITRLFAAPR